MKCPEFFERQCISISFNFRAVKKEVDFLQFESFNSHSVQPSSSYTFSGAIEVNENLNNRMPLDLSNLRDLGNLCKLEIVKNEIPYLVKYKLQEGKHVKIWQCKTCELIFFFIIHFYSSFHPTAF
jgi:hypothetical protein